MAVESEAPSIGSGRSRPISDGIRQSGCSAVDRCESSGWGLIAKESETFRVRTGRLPHGEGLIPKESATCRAGSRTPTMSLTVEQLRNIARATVSGEPGAREAALTALGDPSPGEVAHDALAYVDHADRNVRVAALRVLSGADGPNAIEGVLRGLDDP